MQRARLDLALHPEAETASAQPLPRRVLARLVVLNAARHARRPINPPVSGPQVVVRLAGRELADRKHTNQAAADARRASSSPRCKGVPVLVLG
jgi:hypothetical protein